MAYSPCNDGPNPANLAVSKTNLFPLLYPGVYEKSHVSCLSVYAIAIQAAACSIQSTRLSFVSSSFLFTDAFLFPFFVLINKNRCLTFFSYVFILYSPIHDTRKKEIKREPKKKKNSATFFLLPSSLLSPITPYQSPITNHRPFPSLLPFVPFLPFPALILHKR